LIGHCAKIVIDPVIERLIPEHSTSNRAIMELTQNVSVSMLPNASYREACKVSHPFRNERNLSAARTPELQKGLAARYPEAF